MSFADWRNADCVCFDVDSTVISCEGIDVLASYSGQAEAVAAMTRNAMSGNILFEDALRARLELIRPTTAILETLIAEHSLTFVPGVQSLIARLRERDVSVFLVSGGFLQMIAPLARELGVPDDHVFCNVLEFDASGNYTGFDATQFTARTGGKARAVEEIRRLNHFHKIVMIGDGVTDLEAKADLFIGFGGVVERARVKENADWFVYSFAELIDALD